MKKILFALLLILLSASQANALSAAVQAALSSGSSSSCGVLFEQSTQNGYAIMGDDLTHTYNMSTFTPTAGVIKTVYLKGYRSGTGSTLTAYLCDSKDAPPVPDDDPACVAADATFNTSGIGTDYSYNIKFNWAAGYTVDAARHILMIVDDGADAVNYTRWGYNNDVADNYIRYSAAGATWNSADTTAQGSMKVTSCVE